MKSTWMQNPDGIKTEKKKNCIAAAGLKRRKLDAALDSIRLKYGNDKVTRASIMNSSGRIGRKAKAENGLDKHHT